MTDKIIMHEQEHDQLEVLIGKLHEANIQVMKLANETANSNFGAEMDVMSGELHELIKKTRDIGSKSEIMAYQEYRNRFLK